MKVAGRLQDCRRTLSASSMPESECPAALRMKRPNAARSEYAPSVASPGLRLPAELNDFADDARNAVRLNAGYLECLAAT
jgi:hypothetical protein